MGLNKKRMIYKCNLNYQQLHLYLKFLLIKKLLARKVDNDGKEKVASTTKGNNLVKDFQALQTIMK